MAGPSDVIEWVCKKPLCIFFYLTFEAGIVCGILSKVKSELKIDITYMCDFGIDISITHVYILMEEVYFEF